jgi:cytochrome c oxidase subunit 2
MPEDIPLFPEQASTAAPRVDWLYLYLVANAAFFTALICVLILFFAIRYRRGAKVSRSGAPIGNLGLEILWAFIPLMIMLVSFGWGTSLFLDAHQPPDGAMEVSVVGKQWMWKVQHSAGRREINELHVPVGQPVRVRLISEDVIHSFFVPAFRVKQDALPGRYTSVWFEATKVGEYHWFCAEYCGTSHSSMRGHIIVMEPDDFARWLEEEEEEPARVAGRRVFQRMRCDSCHQERDTPRGPSLAGLFEHPVVLRDGQTITADPDYVRESILQPAARLVAGYEATMPSYESHWTDGILSEEKIVQLQAYIASLPRTPR